MAYRVLIYCPDQHILYEGSTPDRRGAGGGIVARIRLAQALARRGHEVAIMGRVPRRHVHEGVTYLPLDERDLPAQVDVLVLTSSGGALTLEPARDLPVRARLSEAWVHGTPPLGGLDELKPRYVVGVSNFVRRVMAEEWGLPAEQLFVIYNGATELPARHGLGGPPRRDPFGLIYASHPSKGLDAALGVLRRLRSRDPRYNLQVYGSNALWGGKEDQPPREDGVVTHGMVGQAEVIAGLQRASFALHLQTRAEPFSLALLDALHYGALPIASPVGGHLELIEDGANGFLVPGDPSGGEVQQRAADRILSMNAVPAFQDYLRRRAQALSWTWERQARVWEGHWAQALGEGGAMPEVPLRADGCPLCGGDWLYLADGYHCARCGFYEPHAQAVAQGAGLA